MGDEADYDEYAVDDEEEQGLEGFETYKEQVVFLIDGSKSMLTRFITQQTENGLVDVSYLSYALNFVKHVMKAKIFASPNDELAVLFYGTVSSSNKGNMENVHTFQELDNVDATRIQEVEGYTDDDFKEHIKSYEPPAGTPLSEALRMGLWATSQTLNNKVKATRRVFLITNNDNPTRDTDRPAQFMRTLMQRVTDLKEAGVSLTFIPLPHPGKPFVMQHFWQEVLRAASDEAAEGSSSQASSSSEYTYLEELGQQEVLTQEDVSSYLSAVEDVVRRKMYKRRAVGRLRWRITEELEIAVQVFNLVQPCAPPKTVNVHALQNAILRSDRRDICGATGAMLTNDKKVTVFVPSKDLGERFPPHVGYAPDAEQAPKVKFDREVVNEVKAVKPPGLKLLGFKPRSCLKSYHQGGHSSFLRPNDGEVRGSSTVFKALINAMNAMDQIAICRYRRGKSSDTRLVALLAQPEVVTQSKVQLQAEGLHLLALPFMDDIRTPEVEPAVVGNQIYAASEVQVEKAGVMLRGLTFQAEKGCPVRFECEEVHNPFLQRQYRAIECRAMGQDIPPMAEAEERDETKPEVESMEANYHDAIVAFKEAVYGPGSEGEAAGSKKRKAADAGASGTAAAAGSGSAAEAYHQYDWANLAVKGIDKLTIPQLKIYLQHHRLPVSGKKGDLIDRIKGHLGVDF